MRKFIFAMPLLALFLIQTGCNSESDILAPYPPTPPIDDEKPVDPIPPSDDPSFGDYHIPEEYRAYYSGIDFRKQGEDLKKQLALLITKTHTPRTYTHDIWNSLAITDEVASNTDEIYLLYGWPEAKIGDIHSYTAKKTDQNNSAKPNVGWNREHTFAKANAVPKLVAHSQAGTLPKTPNEIAGHDAHHLRPTNIKFNDERANLKFIDANGNAKVVGNNKGFYPGDTWKGEVARMMMYMHIRYEANNMMTSADKNGIPLNTSTGVLKDHMIDLYLKWNAESPVSDIERRRNKYISNPELNQYAQGNRNPFIDNPELANRIWGMPEYQAENKWAKE